jgi:hypothetical protein
MALNFFCRHLRETKQRLLRLSQDDGAAGWRGGGQAASIAIFPFRAAEMQRVFPDDDTSPPFCHNLNCLKEETVSDDGKQDFKENVSVE